MDTQQTQNVAAMLAGMSLFISLFVLAALAFAIFLFWRIFAKAGYSGAMSFLILIPGIGGLIVLCILAFGQWKVAPIVALPPTYPPPAGYPPAV